MSLTPPPAAGAAATTKEAGGGVTSYPYRPNYNELLAINDDLKFQLIEMERRAGSHRITAKINKSVIVGMRLRIADLDASVGRLQTENEQLKSFLRGGGVVVVDDLNPGVVRFDYQIANNNTQEQEGGATLNVNNGVMQSEIVGPTNQISCGLSSLKIDGKGTEPASDSENFFTSEFGEDLEELVTPGVMKLAADWPQSHAHSIQEDATSDVEEIYLDADGSLKLGSFGLEDQKANALLEDCEAFGLEAGKVFQSDEELPFLVE